MRKIVLSKNHEKYTISIQSIQDLCFLLYLIATSAHQTGEGFDAIFIRVSFVLFVGFSILNMIATGYIKWNGFIGWFVLFLGYGYLSCLWANSVADAIYYTNTFIQMLGCIICLTNRIKTTKDIDKMLKLLLVSLLYTALLLYIKTPASAWGTERIGGELGLHPNDIGLRFAIGVMISLYFSISKKNYFNYIFVALFTIIAMFSGSRKGLLMCVIAIVLYPILSYKKRNRNDFMKFLFRIILIFLIIAIVYFIIMNNKMFYDVIGVRIESMIKSFEGDASADGSINERNFFIKKAIELFKAHPIFGYGMNNFSTHMAEINYHHVAYSHNNFTELLATLGIVGFTIYYSMIIKMLINLIKNMFCKVKNNYAMNVLFLLILSIICFISYWCVNYQSEYFIILFSLIYMFLKVNKSEEVLK